MESVENNEMKSYLDITLLPNEEIPLYFLWGKLYQQLHLAFVEVKNEQDKVNIGVSFPQYQETYLGCKLRLFAENESDLVDLNLNKWLSRLLDYVHITSIKAVPEQVHEYAKFYRINKRKSNDEKAESTAKRLSITYEQALEKLQGRSEELSNAPFIHMKSLGSGEQFRLLVGKLEVEKVEHKPLFNTYGLSSSSPVPVF